MSDDLCRAPHPEQPVVHCTLKPHDFDHHYSEHCGIGWIGQAEQLRQRPGDQSLPTPNARPSIQSLVRADLDAREQVGIQRYGTPLQPHNGRDAMRDLYEELLDAACYARQVIEERIEQCPEISQVTRQRCLLKAGHDTAHERPDGTYFLTRGDLLGTENGGQ